MTELPRDFLSMNLDFARRAEDLSGLSLAESLLRYTHLYLAFGLGRDFDPGHPFWQDYLSALSVSAEPLETTWQAYCKAQAERPHPPPEIAFGCFTYSVWSGGRVRLHFFRGVPGQSPLRRAHLPERLAELRAMFAHIQAHEHPVTSIVGGSWLYNLEAYTRLFPPAFIATAAREDPPETQFIALWGQFLDHTGQVKPDIAALFRERVESARGLPALLDSFPYPVLRLEAPVEVFYPFYQVA